MSLSSFQTVNDKHTTLVGGTFFATFLIGAIGLGMKNNADFSTVRQFSLHAYQNNAYNADILLAGPFLGKVRVTTAATDPTLHSDDKNIMKFQDLCKNISDVEVQGKCRIMRTPPMNLGTVHSSWSVLGAQSVTTIAKHLFFLSFAFAIFSMSELWMRNGWCRDTQKPLRLIVVGIAIILFFAVFIWDFSVTNLHELEGNTKASSHDVGSVTTGASLWLVCLLIICFSHVDDVVVKDDAQYSDEYKRLEAQLHLTVNASFLILLLMPLFVLLSLAAYPRPVLDVHVQLVFFSYIFFAVLDVFQSRVVSVLASFKENNSLAPGLKMIKAFVVLAFVLCKLFVFMPAWQLMGRNYTPTDNSVPFILHILEIFVVLGLSAFDLAYISGLVRMIYAAWHKTKRLENPESNEMDRLKEIQIHASCRNLVFLVYLGGSYICLAAMTKVS